MSDYSLQPQSFPKILPVEDIQFRLNCIFPENFPNRKTLVGSIAARSIFVFLYGGFIGENGRYLRPSHIYRFTIDQETHTEISDRAKWVSDCIRPRYTPSGERWYQDNTRESIRDDLFRNEFERLGIVGKHIPDNHSTTSSKPIYYLDTAFAELFNPEYSEEILNNRIKAWQDKNLSRDNLAIMALRAKHIQAKSSDIFIEMPDGQRLKLSAGASNNMVKDTIELFCPKYLQAPCVLWISASDKKSYPEFVRLAEEVGLVININTTLPDLILADLSTPLRIIMCEIVATDGPITIKRIEDFIQIIKQSKIPLENVEYMTIFADREAPAFKKSFPKIAPRGVL